MKQVTKSVALAAITLVTLALMNPAKADGIYGFGIELNASGSGATNSGLSLYGLDNYGDNNGYDLLPSGSSATLRSNWADSSTGTNPTFSLGSVASLTLAGGSLLTYGGDASSATLDYQIIDLTTDTNVTGGYVQVNLPQNATNVTNPGNTRWSTESAGVNLLSGLNTTDTYELETFAFGDLNGNTVYYNNPNNGYNNYGATFTVAPSEAPEPSTWCMVLGGLGVLVVTLRRRSARL